MKAQLKYFAIGGLAFVLFLLARLPASLAFDQLPPGQVQVSGVTGTIWHGSATGLGLPSLQLGKTTWKFQFSNLLRAEFAYDIATQVGGESMTAIVASRGMGKIRLVNVVGRLPVRELAAYLPTGFVTGIADINLKALRLDGNWPIAVDGTITILELTALTTNPPTRFGDYAVTFSDQENFPLTGSLEDLAGPVEVAGQLLLKADRSFELDATLYPEPDAPTQISTMLSFVGPLDDQGRRQLRYSGSL